jgi:uncharacterized OB-fold protein
MRVSENWRLKDARYNLIGTKNEETGEIQFPPRPVAPRRVPTIDIKAKQAVNWPVRVDKLP